MAKTNNKQTVVIDAPQTLEKHQFYGLRLDEEQKIFRDAIWNPEKLIVFCNAKAGTGKTLIATATAHLLVQYGRYDGLVYISRHHGRWKNTFGYLPCRGAFGQPSRAYSL